MLSLRTVLGAALLFAACAWASGCSLDFDKFGRANAKPDSGSSQNDGGAAGGAGGHAGGAGGTGGHGSGGAPGKPMTDGGMHGSGGHPSVNPDAGPLGGPCKNDSTCTPLVCEAGKCVECRSQKQCRIDELCIDNRCIPERKPSRIWASAGGGELTTTGFKLRIGIGTPMPMGDTATTGFKAHLGPSLQQH